LEREDVKGGMAVALSGKVDRRTYEKNSFIFGIIMLIFASIVAGFIAAFLLGGGDIALVERVDISGMLPI